MSTALTQHQSTFPGGQELTDMRNAAALIAQSGLVPDAFRSKPADVMVALLTARGLGIDPMVALQKGYVIKGKFDVEVKIKLGIVQSRVPDFDYEILENSDTVCTLRGGRAGKTPVTSTFTIERAQRMGLTGKEAWRGSPEDMLFERSMLRLLNRTCAGALYNMPVELDDYDSEDDAPAAPVHEASGAEVVVPEGRPRWQPSATSVPMDAPPAAVREGGVEAAMGVRRAMDELSRPAPQTAPASEPAPVDWAGRMLRATQVHYGRDPDKVPGHKAARSKWVKSGTVAEDLLKLANLFYESTGEPAITNLVAMPPMDHERLAKWLEARNEKRAGTGVSEPGGMDASPALSEDAGEVEPEPARTPAGAESVVPAQPVSEAVSVPDEPDEEPMFTEEAEGPVSGGAMLAGKGLGHMVNVLMALRHAAKGERQFVQRSDKTGRYCLVDGALLTAIGSIGQNNAPMAAWLHVLVDEHARWEMLANAVVDEANKLGVSYQ